MRVHSDKPVTLKDGQLGYLHPVNVHVFVPKEKPKKVEPPPNLPQLLERWMAETNPRTMILLATQLGLPASSLLTLHTCYAKGRGSYAFPMCDGAGRLIGIRLRTESGFKFAVTGSRNGIFLPDMPPQKFALCVEGPTSCAAGIALGYYTIGRASDRAGTPFLIEAIRRLGIRRVVLVADNKIKEDGSDDSGSAAARSISEMLPCASAVAVLPSKDLRSFYCEGGRAQLLDSITSTLVWRTV